MNDGGLTVMAARRFAATFDNIGLIVGDHAESVRATPDTTMTPDWQLRIAPTARATVCVL